MNFFITGISTDVGKTIVSAILVEALKADYWKPVQAGNTPSTDSQTVKSLITNADSIIFPEAYLLKNPVSPHLAAKLEGIEIAFDKIVLPKTSNTLIIEGAGGVLSPVNDEYLVIDLIKKFDAKAILVIRNYLGSINHSLLSIEALKSRNIEIAGIVFCGEENKSSEEYIKKHSGLKTLLHVYPEKEINAEMVLKYAVKFQKSHSFVV